MTQCFSGVLGDTWWTVVGRVQEDWQLAECTVEMRGVAFDQRNIGKGKNSSESWKLFEQNKEDRGRTGQWAVGI